MARSGKESSNGPSEIEHYDNLLKATPEERVLGWMQMTKTDKGNHIMGDWMSSIMPCVGLVSVDVDSPNPSATFSYTVHGDHCNRLRNLHGGAAATLFDYLTTMAIAAVSAPDYWRYMGVSRTLNVTYLRPVPVGCEVLIKGEIVQIGRRLATLRGTMIRRSDGAVMATCEHGKVNIDSDIDVKAKAKL
ncbi:Thioesterase superfamily [Geosmithia morbida]|uniref:Thioesterase superfamily n=1 Tax=Geosmithia morbida TaxID=1094350 RepID=A0A9P5D8B7_9HYPO|nr:Thioesterase superfamily [Geosmithia morbida]KAF4126620.1 Thioesterase superfamily [Geosmithia morbida]